MYNEFGWNYYPEIFGEQLLQWLERKALQPKNAMESILVTELGREILVRPEQFRKALCPIWVTEPGRESVVRALQPLNAHCPMEVVRGDREIAVRLEQS